VLWLTKRGQPFLTRQVTAFLKAAQDLGWEEVLEPSDPTVPYDTIARREPVGVYTSLGFPDPRRHPYTSSADIDALTYEPPTAP
jgi:hypothetical protein